MKKQVLMSREFILFNMVFFLAFINMSVFFRLHQYLLALSIDEKWAGFLIGIFSLSGVIFQPFLSPFVNERNMRKVLTIGITITVAALLSYRWATTFWLLVGLRVIHGVGFVTLITALNAALVLIVPVSRSGQAFGLVSINVLLPLAVVPALLDWLSFDARHFVDILSVAALLMIPAAALPKFVRERGLSELAAEHRPTPVLMQVRENLKEPRVLILLGINFLAFLAYAPVFYFLKEYAETKGIANPGTFFTVAAGMMIAIRLFGGHLFDHVNKARLLLVSLMFLSCAYGLLTMALPGAFLGVALLFGIGWGLFMPFLNALLFEISVPSARALNLNLAMVMLQAGYFIGPIVGGFIMSKLGYKALFLCSGSMTLIGACLNLVLIKNHR